MLPQQCGGGDLMQVLRREWHLRRQWNLPSRRCLLHQLIVVLLHQLPQRRQRPPVLQNHLDGCGLRFMQSHRGLRLVLFRFLPPQRHHMRGKTVQWWVLLALPTVHFRHVPRAMLHFKHGHRLHLLLLIWQLQRVFLSLLPHRQQLSGQEVSRFHVHLQHSVHLRQLPYRRHCPSLLCASDDGVIVYLLWHLRWQLRRVHHRLRHRQQHLPLATGRHVLFRRPVHQR